MNAQTSTNQFQLIDNDTITVIINDLADLSDDLKEVILNWLRDGKEVQYIRAQPPDQTPAHTSRKPSTSKTYKQPFIAGARCYLKWTALKDLPALSSEQQLHLSQYRTTPGQVECIPGYGLRSVRFNGDPPIDLKLNQLTHAPYTE